MLQILNHHWLFNIGLWILIVLFSEFSFFKIFQNYLVFADSIMCCLVLLDYVVVVGGEHFKNSFVGLVNFDSGYLDSFDTYVGYFAVNASNSLDLLVIIEAVVIDNQENDYFEY